MRWKRFLKNVLKYSVKGNNKVYQSKAIKVNNTKSSKLWKLFVRSPFYDWYSDFLNFIERPFRKLKKLYDWQVNVFNNDFDFDGHSLFGIIEYKLKRLEKCLENGCAIQDPKDIKALKIMIKLSKRLMEDNYENRFYRKHDQKWGESIWWSARIEGSTSTRCTFTRPNAKTDKQKARERKESLLGIELSNSIRLRDERWLYSLLSKHLRNLWD